MLAKNGIVFNVDSTVTTNENTELKVSWVHLDYLSDDAKKFLQKSGTINNHFVDVLTATETRPRCLQTSENSMIVFLRCINSIAKKDETDDMLSLRCYIENNQLITLSHRTVPAVIELYKEVFHGNYKINSIPELFLDLLDKVTISITNELDNFIDDVYDIEEILDKKRVIGFDQKLSDWRGKAINFHRYLSPQRELFGILANFKTQWTDNNFHSRIREAQERMLRTVENLESARSRLMVLKEEAENRKIERTNKTVYILTMLAAVFMPLNFFTSFLGANIGGIPLSENPQGFAIVATALSVIAFIQIMIFKHLKWF